MSVMHTNHSMTDRPTNQLRHTTPASVHHCRPHTQAINLATLSTPYKLSINLNI